MTKEQVLLIEETGPVEWVTLNRPEQRNALNADMVEALVSYFEGLREREDTRIVVLGAAGKHFSAGADLSGNSFEGMKRNPRHVWSVQRRIARIYLAMRKCPQPIIALVQGAACGGGGGQTPVTASTYR